VGTDPAGVKLNLHTKASRACGGRRPDNRPKKRHDKLTKNT
jgi:hypothetical protein